MPFDAIIFDMDGLLLDSERMFRIVWQLAATDLGVEMNDAIFFSLIGLNRRSAEARLKSVYGPTWDHEALNSRIDHHWHAIGGHDAIPVKSGVTELLDHLDASSLPRAVATSTPRLNAEQKLTKVGLLDRFHGLVGGDEVAAGKPAPDPYLKAAALLNVDPARCLALEDSPNGLRAARAAGMTVIMVPDLIAPTEALRDVAHHVMDDLHSVRDWITGLQRLSTAESLLQR
jgi:beta-phosphoglucomutase-like phosphatase (HAD superfamily)